MTAREIKHLYWRAGFGLTPKEINELLLKDKSTIINNLFEKSKTTEPLTTNLSYLKSYPESLLKGNKKLRQELNKVNREKTKVLNTIWLNKIATTNTVLRERMTLFWANHFVCRDMATNFILKYNNTLRTHALGNFKVFVKAIAREASMIRYLNLNQNKKDSPNENFSRELLELFTLGEGNYKEKDIKECARAFTGYFHKFNGDFYLSKRHHDKGIKEFFNKKGVFTGDDIVDIILEDKQCARHICEKVYSYFVNTKINSNHINEMVNVFYGNYDIEKLMRFVFSSSWFYNNENIGTKIKSPVDLLIGMQKIIPIRYRDNNELLKILRLLDQMLLDPPHVAGWEGGKSWITTSSLMLRIKLPSMILEKESYTYQTKGSIKAKNLRIIPVKNKFQDKLNAYVNWKAYKKNVKKVSLNELKNALILCNINPGTTRYIATFGRRPKKKNLVKLMSLPEYQMC